MNAHISLEDLEWGAELQFPNSRSLTRSPHFVGGRYPCRSVAFVPRLLLANHAVSKEALSVLDPFMGSGTTAIEAMKTAASVHGVEIDPYAKLIANVATRSYSVNEILELRSLSEDVISNFGTQRVDVDLHPDLKNIGYWFEEDNFQDLLKLKTSIFKNVKSGKFRDFFLTAFGDIIRATSKAERQSLKPYISKKYVKVPKQVLPEFSRTIVKYIDAVEGSFENKSGGIVWEGSDATSFEVSQKVDIAITSPPYINAMDYTRCIKLESAWIGTADDTVIQDVRNAQLGESIRRHNCMSYDFVSEIASKYFNELKVHDAEKYQIALSFFDDMAGNLNSVKNALTQGGSYYVIIGNSSIRGVKIDTHAVIAEIGSALGFSWEKYFKYKIKDHRTSIPRGNRGGKIEYEHVLGLQA